MNKTLAFIGAGNMARAMIMSLVKQNYPVSKIIATALHAETLAPLAETDGIQTMIDNVSAVAQADVVILAIKPKVIKEVCLQIADTVNQRKPLIISIASGVRAQAISHWLQGYQNIIRSIPNTPATIGAAFSGLYAEANVLADARQQAQRLFQGMGEILWVNEEKDLSVVTAIAGSSPAYFFYMIEALEAAGQAQGLTESDARLMARQAAYGAAKMALQSPLSANALKAQVMSPQGTTERAIEVMRNHDFERMMLEAADACYARSEELANTFDVK